MHENVVNPLKQKELAREAKATEKKVVDAQVKILQEGQRGVATADSLLGTAQQILNDENLNDVIGSYEGDTGFFSADTIRTDETELDTIAKITLLGNKITMDNLDKMSGVLTDKDLEVLRGSLQSLDRKQSEEAFRSSLNEIIRITEKARAGKQEAAGIEPTQPDVGPGAERPGTVAGHSTESINAALNKYKR